jgi:hypothetical protein
MSAENDLIGRFCTFCVSRFGDTESKPFGMTSHFKSQSDISSVYMLDLSTDYSKYLYGVKPGSNN